MRQSGFQVKSSDSSDLPYEVVKKPVLRGDGKVEFCSVRVYPPIHRCEVDQMVRPMNFWNDEIDFR
jgi:hypothetical protein